MNDDINSESSSNSSSVSSLPLGLHRAVKEDFKLLEYLAYRKRRANTEILIQRPEQLLEAIRRNFSARPNQSQIHYTIVYWHRSEGDALTRQGRNRNSSENYSPFGILRRDQQLASSHEEVFERLNLPSADQINQRGPRMSVSFVSSLEIDQPELNIDRSQSQNEKQKMAFHQVKQRFQEKMRNQSQQQEENKSTESFIRAREVYYQRYGVQQSDSQEESKGSQDSELDQRRRSSEETISFYPSNCTKVEEGLSNQRSDRDSVQMQRKNLYASIDTQDQGRIQIMVRQTIYCHYSSGCESENLDQEKEEEVKDEISALQFNAPSVKAKSGSNSQRISVDIIHVQENAFEMEKELEESKEATKQVNNQQRFQDLGAPNHEQIQSDIILQNAQIDNLQYAPVFFQIEEEANIRKIVNSQNKLQNSTLTNKKKGLFKETFEKIKSIISRSNSNSRSRSANQRYNKSSGKSNSLIKGGRDRGDSRNQRLQKESKIMKKELRGKNESDLQLLQNQFLLSNDRLRDDQRWLLQKLSDKDSLMKKVFQEKPIITQPQRQRRTRRNQNSQVLLDDEDICSQAQNYNSQKSSDLQSRVQMNQSGQIVVVNIQERNFDSIIVAGWLKHFQDEKEKEERKVDQLNEALQNFVRSQPIRDVSPHNKRRKQAQRGRSREEAPSNQDSQYDKSLPKKRKKPNSKVRRLFSEIRQSEAKRNTQPAVNTMPTLNLNNLNSKSQHKKEDGKVNVANFQTYPKAAQHSKQLSQITERIDETLTDNDLNQAFSNIQPFSESGRPDEQEQLESVLQNEEDFQALIIESGTLTVDRQAQKMRVARLSDSFKLTDVINSIEEMGILSQRKQQEEMKSQAIREYEEEKKSSPHQRAKNRKETSFTKDSSKNTEGIKEQSQRQEGQELLTPKDITNELTITGQTSLSNILSELSSKQESEEREKAKLAEKMRKEIAKYRGSNFIKQFALYYPSEERMTELVAEIRTVSVSLKMFDKDYLLEGLQFLVNELQRENEIQTNMRRYTVISQSSVVEERNQPRHFQTALSIGATQIRVTQTFNNVIEVERGGEEGKSNFSQISSRSIPLSQNSPNQQRQNGGSGQRDSSQHKELKLIGMNNLGSQLESGGGISNQHTMGDLNQNSLVASRLDEARIYMDRIFSSYGFTQVIDEKVAVLTEVSRDSRGNPIRQLSLKQFNSLQFQDQQIVLKIQYDGIQVIQNHQEKIILKAGGANKNIKFEDEKDFEGDGAAVKVDQVQKSLRSRSPPTNASVRTTQVFNHLQQQIWKNAPAITDDRDHLKNIEKHVQALMPRDARCKNQLEQKMQGPIGQKCQERAIVTTGAQAALAALPQGLMNFGLRAVGVGIGCGIVEIIDIGITVREYMSGNISLKAMWVKLGLKTVKNAVNCGSIILGSLIGGAIGTLICPVLGTVIGKIVGGVLAGTISNAILTKQIEQAFHKHDKSLNYKQRLDLKREAYKFYQRSLSFLELDVSVSEQELEMMKFNKLRVYDITQGSREQRERKLQKCIEIMMSYEIVKHFREQFLAKH